MAGKRVLFVAYYWMRPVGMIGVFKRCLRLMGALPEDYEVFFLNFGEVPPDDPAYRRVAHRVQLVRDPGSAEGMENLYRRLKLDTIVLGECPLAGSMRRAYRTGARCGLPMIAIDNYYGKGLARLTQCGYWHIRKWLFLGLLSRGRGFGRSIGFEVVPPLIPAPGDCASRERDRIVVMGYDRATVEMSFQVLKSLPPGQRVDFFLPGQSKELYDGLPMETLPHDFHFLHAPTDIGLSDSISHARLVLGKAGFQQVVESILLGSPIVCQMYDSGLRQFMVPTHLKPYVKLVWTRAQLERAMPHIQGWAAGNPILPWMGVPKEIPDTVSFAASRLAAMIEE